MPCSPMNFRATTSAHSPEPKVVDQAAPVGVGNCAAGILGLRKESEEQYCTA